MICHAHFAHSDEIRKHHVQDLFPPREAWESCRAERSSLAFLDCLFVSQRHCEHRYGGEAGTLAQLPQRATSVLHQYLHLILPLRVRKNWTHIGSPQAGSKVAAILSVVESCRRLKLPVREYLAAVLSGLVLPAPAK